MKIRYVGSSGRRIVGEFEWNSDNGFVEDVTDSEIVADLLTYPRPEFVLVEDEPLTSLPQVGEQRAVELALAGIASIEDLAMLDDDGVTTLADSIWASEKQVTKWAALARETLGKE